MSIDRRKNSRFYYICEQHLAEILRPTKDAYGDLPKQDYGARCDMTRCPLSADFDYFPNMTRRISNVKKSNLISLEDVWKA